MDYLESITSHYEKIWGKNYSTLTWNEGPKDKVPKEFCILEFKPNDIINYWVYVTCNLSDLSNEFPIELCFFSLTKSSEIIELSTMVASFHRNDANLGLGHTVFFGKQSQKDSNCEYGLISLPYINGPDLENFNFPKSSSKIIKVYWLIPITKEEKDYKSKNGLEALEDIFEENEINYLDVKRKSLVKG